MKDEQAFSKATQPLDTFHGKAGLNKTSNIMLSSFDKASRNIVGFEVEQA